MNEDILQKLIQEASAIISDGLSHQDSADLIAEFEKFLKMSLDKIYSRVTPKLDEIALRIGRSIIDEVSKVSPRSRFEYIQQQLLDQEIGDLDRITRDIAEESISDKPDLPVLRAKAKVSLEKLEKYANLLNQKGEDWQKRYGRTLSEAFNDCRFVLGQSPTSSLRLGRTIKFMQDMQQWPPDWYKELWVDKN